MALETNCQTPGATFKVLIGPECLVACVEFGRDLDLSKDECQLLELNIHNALELVLRPYFLLNPRELKAAEEREWSDAIAANVAETINGKEKP